MRRWRQEDCIVVGGKYICPKCVDHPRRMVSGRTNCKEEIKLDDRIVQCGCWGKIHECGEKGRWLEREFQEMLDMFVRQMDEDMRILDEDWLGVEVVWDKMFERWKERVWKKMTGR